MYDFRHKGRENNHNIATEKLFFSLLHKIFCFYVFLSTKKDYLCTRNHTYNHSNKAYA